jgi:hypothetical protein
MHKCINNSTSNLSHLEQLVSDFFPYSQKQLGFDQPVTITFESDENNAVTLLGKTAYYDPATFEVTLFVDGRHPKDVMRSLSHELVHHAQNCRGDFDNGDSTYAGYAQKDPHLRKMEREAYTKGNLIFRDFEDLIKTGKINIEIDFSKSGEPKMSLKEWKNGELNTKLMKKWGLLNESIQEGGDAMYRDEDEEEERIAAAGDAGHGGSGDDHYQFDKKEREAKLQEDSGEDQAWNDWKNEHADDDHIREIRHHLRALEEDRDHDRHDAEYDHDDYEDDRKDESISRAVDSASRKISVREAKEITRRIIERVKKEGK